MAQFMKVSGTKGLDKVMEDWFIRMETRMREIGVMIGQMDKEVSPI